LLGEEEVQGCLTGARTVVLLGRVVGNVWGARQAEGLDGHRLLVVRPLTARLQPADKLVVACDRLGAGPGELVLVAHGSRCRDLTLGEGVPTKEVTVAIVDDVEVRS
jgi:ethanolamine utilization protein EutN